VVTATVELGVPGVSVQPGDHVCAFFRGPAGRDEILLPFLRSGIKSGDKCIAVLDQAEGAAVRRGLRDDCDVDAALTSHQLDLLESGDTYLQNGLFSTEAMLAFWSDAVGSCLAKGPYEFARSLGEMTWALRQLPGVEQLVDYESELNRFLPQYPQVIICLYDLDLFDGHVVVDLLRTHPKLLLCGSVLDNPYYLAPDEYLARRDAAALT
jgi:hypothetical protein